MNISSPMSSTEFQNFCRMFKENSPPINMSMEETRIHFDQLMSRFKASPDIVFSPTSFGRCQGTWVKPPKISSKKTVLFFHGGAYSAGSWQSHQDLLGRIAKSGECKVCAINYRLAPENPFPAALEDAWETYQTLSKEGHSLIVAGSSAGGGLALALLLKLKQLQQKLPEGAILLCPWVDLTVKGQSFLTNQEKDILSRSRAEAAAGSYLAGHDAKDPLASPLHGDLSRLPPLLIQAGTHEVLWSEVESLAQRASQAGTEVSFQPFKEMFHTWQLFAAQIPEGQQAIDEIGKFIRER